MRFSYPLASNTLPRKKPAVPPSPTYKPSATPPVFVPKESPAPLPSLYIPAYNAQQNHTPTYSSQNNDNYNYPPSPNSYNQYDSQPYASPSTPKVSYNSLQNYNTAPRGWGQNKTGYKPITFDKPKSVYSDFWVNVWVTVVSNIV